MLGFPCNQFGSQEPGDEAEIGSFCSTTYDVTFPMFAKVDVNGAATHPLYQHLEGRAPGVLGTEAIKWNFTKFLVDRERQGRHALRAERHSREPRKGRREAPEGVIPGGAERSGRSVWIGGPSLRRFAIR